ncbi:MAG TPA: peptidoglycan DD-metalloendopeptidase family protein [Candidatus Levybacteria bacterium]|nr:peptidoglycan DD-metalloendopeptidase family protein [Candidatus Levybacteria bacterium]
MISKGPISKLARAFSRLSTESLLAQTIIHTVQFSREIGEFSRFFYNYNTAKVSSFSRIFEGNKNRMVKNVLIKRGKRNRMFLHVSAMGVLSVGITISPLISDSDLLSEGKAELIYAQEESVLAAEDVFHTQESEKPRSEILDYTVQKGDTVSTIGKRFGVDEDTIRWANDIKNDSIAVGDTLKILPVSGIAHKVERGDTVYTIAKKYDANPQGLVDFPFNDFANPQTFSLVEGQMVIVPDGVKPAERSATPRQPRYIARQGNEAVVGGFAWPVRGTMNQYYSWYHRGVDLGASVGTPVLAATNGVASEVYTSGWNGGYGTHVIVSGSNGYSSLYAHMSSVNVSPGQEVVAGQTVLGWVGMTGRTTGAHLHFEIRGAGGGVDPLAFLR